MLLICSVLLLFVVTLKSLLIKKVYFFQLHHYFLPTFSKPNRKKNTRLKTKINKLKFGKNKITFKQFNYINEICANIHDLSELFSYTIEFMYVKSLTNNNRMKLGRG